MKTINVFKILVAIIAILLAPLLIILVPFSLSFALLAFVLHQLSKGARMKPAAIIIFALLALVLNAICAWFWVEIDQGFGDDSTFSGELQGIVLFSVLGIATLICTLKTGRTK